MKQDIEMEKDSIDFVTAMMKSADFLKCISDTIFSEDGSGKRISVEDFYIEWKQARGFKEDVIPFNLGVIVGYMYCGILLTKEKWYNQLPTTELKYLDESYGISANSVKIPQKDITFRDAVRRIRNALGHGHMKVDIPEDVFTKEELLTKASFTFWDEDAKGDAFEATIKINEMVSLVKKIHSLSHSHVRNKM